MESSSSQRTRLATQGLTHHGNNGGASEGGEEGGKGGALGGQGQGRALTPC